MKIAVAGASGFIGRHLIAEFDRQGIEYAVVSRNPNKARKLFPGSTEVLGWDPPEISLNLAELGELDAFVNLAGVPVAQRWTSSIKAAIRSSRVDSTRLIAESLNAMDSPLPVFVNASAIGYYGPRDSTPLSEDAPPGSGFLAEVCQEWEAESYKASTEKIRVVNLRIGIVLGRDGGALGKMLTPFKLGVGGPIGKGNQWMSWIHIDDVIGLVMFSVRNAGLLGGVNATAPEPVTNRDFSSKLGHALHRPAILPAPVFALRLVFGEFAEMLATGQRILPEKALSLGYSFQFPKLETALSDIVKN